MSCQSRRLEAVVVEDTDHHPVSLAATQTTVAACRVLPLGFALYRGGARELWNFPREAG